jgi:hypothetical protein
MCVVFAIIKACGVFVDVQAGFDMVLCFSLGVEI